MSNKVELCELADEAKKLEIERTISLVGNVEGSVEFDGSKNVEIQTSIKGGDIKDTVVTFEELTTLDQIESGENISSIVGKVKRNFNSIERELNNKLDKTENALSAKKLEEERTISLVGNVEGSVNFDGSKNVEIQTRIKDIVIDDAIKIGKNTNANSDASIAIGNSAKANGAGSIALGVDATVSEPGSIALGYDAKACGLRSIALGYGANGCEEGATALGVITLANREFSTALGHNAKACGRFSTSVGSNSEATEFISTAIGDYTLANKQGSTALGVWAGRHNNQTNNAMYLGNASGHWGALSRIESAVGITVTSDVRFKHSIQKVNNSLCVLKRVEPIVYNWYPEKIRTSEDTFSVGLSAQSVEKSFKEAHENKEIDDAMMLAMEDIVIKDTSNTQNRAEYKLTTANLIPLLINGITDLNKIVEGLNKNAEESNKIIKELNKNSEESKRNIEELKQEINDIKSKL